MSPELAKWILGALATATVTIVGAVAYLSAVVFRIGQKYGAVEASLEVIQKAGEKFDKAGERLERIPVIENKVDTLGNVQARMTSILPEMQAQVSHVPNLVSKVDQLWAKVFSIDGWRKSRPNIGNGSGGGE